MRVALHRTSRSIGNLGGRGGGGCGGCGVAGGGGVVVVEIVGVVVEGLVMIVVVDSSRDAEVVGVSEGLLEEPRPLLGDPAHLHRLVRGHHLEGGEGGKRREGGRRRRKDEDQHLELHVPGAGVGAPRPLDHQRHVTVTVGDLEPAQAIQV